MLPSSSVGFESLGTCRSKIVLCQRKSFKKFNFFTSLEKFVESVSPPTRWILASSGKIIEGKKKLFLEDGNQTFSNFFALWIF